MSAKQLNRDMGFIHAPNFYNHPDFAPSIKILVEDEEYSLVDVGLFFNRTRERARQWCDELGINHAHDKGNRGLFVMRVWNDDQNRFVPVKRSVMREKIDQIHKAAQLEEKKKQLETRQKEMTEILVNLKNTLGRDPTDVEMATAVKGTQVSRNKASGILVKMWFLTGSVTKENYHAFRLALLARGIKVREKGEHGHINKKEKAIVCRRGHPFSKTHGVRQHCTICHQWRARARRALKAGKPIPPEPMAAPVKFEPHDSKASQK